MTVPLHAFAALADSKTLAVSCETAPAAGTNIQGPSVIRVPDWVKGRLGRYYLYFADHKGRSIRLAYADSPVGPWRYFGDVLALEQTPFPTEITHTPEQLQGLTPPPDWPPEGMPGTQLLSAEAVTPHIASPDAHVRASAQRILLYYHGLESFGRQVTRLAVSHDGLQFEALSPVLGPSYFRVFEAFGRTFALVMPGHLYEADDVEGPFTKVRDLFECPRQRHTAVFVDGDVLHVFWSRVADAPECILCTRFLLDPDVARWQRLDEVVVTRPERAWEGALLPVSRSWRSSIAHPVRQLRDPAFLRGEEGDFLFYAAAGEAGIGVCRLERVARPVLRPLDGWD